MTEDTFEGSIFQKLGYDATQCEYCGAHLYGGICLNGCHLNHGEYLKMQRIFREIEMKNKARKCHDDRS